MSFGSDTSSNGTGSVNRQEKVNLTVAAVITDRLPNGNLVIGGSQEVRINNELRELLVSGVIRPEDIASDNTIEHTKIAEARISYGGRGDISQVQRDKYGKLIYDQITPFCRAPASSFGDVVEPAAAGRLPCANPYAEQRRPPLRPALPPDHDLPDRR